VTKPFKGSWRITKMELWDEDAMDLDGPAHIKFGVDRTGDFGFIAVRGWMDCRFGERDGKPLVEFSWEGNDDTEQACGRGWAVVEKDGSMTGRIYFHQGDDSTFTAARADREPTTKRKRR
jgi:hypothetical protein